MRRALRQDTLAAASVVCATCATVGAAAYETRAGAGRGPGLARGSAAVSLKFGLVVMDEATQVRAQRACMARPPKLQPLLTSGGVPPRGVLRLNRIHADSPVPLPRSCPPAHSNTPQCSEPESLIPLSLLQPWAQCVLVGDPQQLPPTVLHQDAAPLLSVTLFRRLLQQLAHVGHGRGDALLCGVDLRVPSPPELLSADAPPCLPPPNATPRAPRTPALPLPRSLSSSTQQLAALCSLLQSSLLAHQFRMHPLLAHFSSHAFYAGACMHLSCVRACVGTF